MKNNLKTFSSLVSQLKRDYKMGGREEKFSHFDFLVYFLYLLGLLILIIINETSREILRFNDGPC